MQNSTLAKIALTAVVAVAGVGFFVKTTFSHAQHYRMVDDLLKEDLGSWEGKELKVHGWVLSNSIKSQMQGQEMLRTFVLQKDGKKIRVFTTGPVPDTFKDQSEVVATGHIVPAAEKQQMASALGLTIESDMRYVVDATELQAKCPSKYNGPQSNKNLSSDFK
jgi:cytochrome c-type biogenesis protein CcmE